jgi:hypothetical protein
MAGIGYTIGGGMIRAEQPNSGTGAGLESNAMTLKSLIDLIRNDSFAISFQSLGQYRSALIKAASGVKPEA